MNISAHFPRRINWVNTLFICINALVAVFGTLWLALEGALIWQTLAFAFIYTTMTGMGITCGYHRLFSHLAYQAKKPIKVILALLGSATFEGSVLDWCTDHRDHHRYTDTDLDPYNAKRGFWFSHVGWLFFLDPKKRDFSNVVDLKQSWFLRFQHRFYVPVAIFMGFIVPMMIASLWGDWVGGLIIAGALRIFTNQNLTFFVNSVCHIFGKQTYSDYVTAKDNWFTALFTYGEGYHNFHHKFPKDYRNGIKAYHFDPSKWLIKLMHLTGCAWNLKTVPTHRIVQCRLEMDEQRLNKRASSGFTLSSLNPIINQVREKVLQTLSKVEELEKMYQELKQSKSDYVMGKMTEYKLLLQEQRKRLKAMKRELRFSMKLWSKMVQASLMHLQKNYVVE